MEGIEMECEIKGLLAGIETDRVGKSGKKMPNRITIDVMGTEVKVDTWKEIPKEIDDLKNCEAHVELIADLVENRDATCGKVYKNYTLKAVKGAWSIEKKTGSALLTNAPMPVEAPKQPLKGSDFPLRPMDTPMERKPLNAVMEAKAEMPAEAVRLMLRDYEWAIKNYTDIAHEHHLENTPESLNAGIAALFIAKQRITNRLEPTG
jgi:hypothetical protein